MSFGDGALLWVAAFGAGALNSVAGGGSFLSFPALVFLGVPPVLANATSTVALWPGSVASAVAYRAELRLAWSSAKGLVGLSLAGGAAGAALLLATPARAFEAAVPFLLLAATLVFTFGSRIRQGAGEGRSRRLAAAAWLLICIYGGYFGGGLGLLMLAALSVLGVGDVHRMNGLKSALGALVNAVAVALFAFAGAVQWLEASVMVVGSMVGGYAGARISRRVDSDRVRVGVVALGWLLTAAFFLRWWRA